jgi:phage tail-like protein
MALAGTGLRTDPLLAFNFVITLLDTSSVLAAPVSAATAAVSDVAVGGFTECSGLEMTLDVEEYKEGGRNSEILQFPTRVKWSKITLKKGIASSTALWDWHYGFAAGNGKRRDGVIVLLNDLRAPNNIWYFRRGLPTRYTGPTLNAAQSSVAIETIEITHEGIFQLPLVGVASSIATAAAAGGAL